MVKHKIYRSHAGDVEPPATKYPAVNTNREEDEQSRVLEDATNDDVSSLKPSGELRTDAPSLKTRNAPLLIGTWNVRTLFQLGKFDNLLQEIEDMKIDVMGISETRWTESGCIKREEYTMVYSGGKEHEHGVGIVMKNKVARSMMGYWPVGDRIIMCKLHAHPFNVNLLQVYAPTTDHSDEEVEQFYEDLQNCLKHAKSGEVLITMGDFNAKVGDEAIGDCVGKYGLGNRNERGERFIEFCQTNHLQVMNTQFKHEKRHLYTWKSPGDLYRNQIDYIAINNRYRNNVKNCRTYPGADIGSDHNPVVLKLKIKLKILKQKQPRTLKYDVSVLVNSDTKVKYSVEVSNRYECLMSLEETPTIEKEIENQWGCLKQAISETNQDMLPLMTTEAKQPWMTTEILNLMKVRKKNKNKDTNVYKTVDSQIKKKCIEAKENWYNMKCIQIESLAKVHNQGPMYQKIKEFTKKSTGSSNCVKNKKGDMVFEAEKIMERWMEYVEELFDDCRNDDPIKTFLRGPVIMEEEVERCLNRMKSGKAQGIDGITADMLKALGEFGVSTLTEMCNKMYETAYLPEDLRTSIFILLPKKPKAIECSDFRTISLMCHILKLLLSIIMRRISNHIDSEISEEQAGFKKNSGTREAIFNLKMIAEKHLEKQKDLFICFIDYSKAFDSVNHKTLIETLQNIGIDENDVAIISRLYWNQITRIKTNTSLSDAVNIKKGVRQGCVLSPSLFNIYTEYIFRGLESMPGVKVGGRLINNLRYADDTALMAESSEDLQNLVTAVKNESAKLGLNINIKKTKSMVISRSELVPKARLLIDGTEVEQVKSFVYLGQLISEDGRSDNEIKKRIHLAKMAFLNMKKILINQDISGRTKFRLLKCYIWSLFLYGSETWTTKKSTEAKIEAFEMWCYRRMERVSWKEMKTNEEVLRDIGMKEKCLLKMIKKRKLAYYGHIRRHNTLQKTILEGSVSGRRGRGRRRTTWTMNIAEMTERSINECCELALDRDGWRTMTADLLEMAPR